MFNIRNVTIDYLKNTGIEVNWDSLNDSINATIDNYKRIKLYNKFDNKYLKKDNVYSSIVKKSAPYLNIVQIVNDFAARASGEHVAFLNFWIANSFWQTSCKHFDLSFLEKSFYYYKEHLTDSNYSIFLDCGTELSNSYVAQNLFRCSLVILKYCLEVIEKHEGVKGDDYCNFLYETRLAPDYFDFDNIYIYLKWFIGDYTITDSSLGKKLYPLLCNYINTVLERDKSGLFVLPDEGRRFLKDSYDKYRKIIAI